MEELAQLVSRAQAGELDAYGEIVRRFQDMAYGYAYSILGDFHLAEDAAQEAFVEAYRTLTGLREPAAFPGWFRRIVFKRCDRITRRKRAPTVPMTAAAGAASAERDPAQAAEEREMKDKVLEAIRALPEHERAATTLFYINGYSHNDIAEFLEVPVGTVKTRLHSSRKRLKEKMVKMVEETLHENAPDERFSRKVIDGLIGRPDLTDIDGHPVQQVCAKILAALPGYERVDGEDIIPESCIMNPWRRQFAFHVDEDVLRTEAHDVTFRAMSRRPSPLRVVAVARAFQDGATDFGDEQIRHQVSVVRVDRDAGLDEMKRTLQDVAEAALGPVEFKYRELEYHWFQPCMGVSAKYKGEWIGISGCGVMTAKTLSDTGHDPSQVSGFMFGVTLEKLAVLKYGIDDIRTLWQPPYVPRD